MPIWNVTDVDEQPELTLSQWSVHEVLNGDRHFVGWAQECGEGRVSSKIVSFDFRRLVGLTQSGRVYRLSGYPGADRDAAYVWRKWAIINGANDFTDVSPDVWAQHEIAVHSNTEFALPPLRRRSRL